MGTTISLNTEHSARETRTFIGEAIEKRIDYIQIRMNKFKNECRQFEERFKMKSEDFIKKFEAGELDDDVQWFDWYAAYRGRELWQKKNEILAGISWNE